MPLVALRLRHFLADSIICMCVFDFRQAQVAAASPFNVLADNAYLTGAGKMVCDQMIAG